MSSNDEFSEIKQMLKQFELPKIDTAMLKQFELPKIDTAVLKQFELPKIDTAMLKQFELPKIDTAVLKQFVKDFQSDRPHYILDRASSYVDVNQVDVEDYKEKIAILIKVFSGIWHVISSETAMKILTLISLMLALEGRFLNSPEINIHNHSDKVEVETDVNGNQIDVFIKEETQEQSNDDKEKQNKDEKWLSAGERT